MPTVGWFLRNTFTTDTQAEIRAQMAPRWTQVVGSVLRWGGLGLAAAGVMVGLVRLVWALLPPCLH